MPDVYQQALEYHAAHQGKLGTTGIVGGLARPDLSLAYTPGVAEPCRVIAKDAKAAYDYTLKGRTVAVISNGSAVLGLGNIGGVAGLPVMEGKSLLIKQFGGVDSFPLVINTTDPGEIITFVKQVAPTFAGINLEDICAPTCFEVEEALQDIGIPVFHDDQHGTAIVVRAALLNAAKVVGKSYSGLRVVIVGAGAAGLAIARMLLGINPLANENGYMEINRVKDVVVVDTQGALLPGRTGQNVYKQAVAAVSNQGHRQGFLEAVIEGFDAVIGVSGPGTIKPEAVAKMADKPIVFAMANPTPEIMPDVAQQAGAYVVATGRSDYPNQINNLLAFPGIFRAVVHGRLTKITFPMKLAASDALASIITDPNPDNIIPNPFHPGLADLVAQAVLEVA